MTIEGHHTILATVFSYSGEDVMERASITEDHLNLLECCSFSTVSTAM